MNHSAVCGDKCAIWQKNDHTYLCLADGLGHGEPAAHAAETAIEYIGAHLFEPLNSIIEGCDRELRQTRGVVLSIACINEQLGHLEYAGVGNIFATMITQKPIFLFNVYGIVGAGIPKLRIITENIKPLEFLAFASDGIKFSANWDSIRNIIEQNYRNAPKTIVEKFGKSHDDAAIIVYRKDLK